MYITDEQLSQYKKDGFLIVENFLNEKERKSALDGFYKHFAPPYQHYIDNNRENDTPKEVLFPWEHSGLNHVTTHPDLINAAERVLGTREIRLGEGHLGMKYAGEEHWTDFHIDYGNNTLGPIIHPDDFMHLACFYCFEDVNSDTAPIRMVPNSNSDDECVPMVVPGGSVCLYSVFTRHAASPFVAEEGHRPAMWVGFNRKDRPWDGARTFTYKSGARGEAMKRFIVEATPRQRELLGFPPPGDSLWTKTFTDGMATRYPGFDPIPYEKARID
ncbi:MAG: phytanoyl-CoA dioxygenase family protein [Candidatus Latescibacterota bacterium]|nr:phytanoyl-CoA dioxygenase family protein [Candidatus Latescibacterota bacterium]